MKCGASELVVRSRAHHRGVTHSHTHAHDTTAMNSHRISSGSNSGGGDDGDDTSNWTEWCDK